jgi:heme-degrading monooxygenase HmoA
MYAVVWTYRALRGREREFERMYAADGDWARLFRRSADYLGTELFRDTADEARYLTMDRWTSRTAYEDFLQTARDDYAALDARGDALTVEETRLGVLADGTC